LKQKNHQPLNNCGAKEEKVTSGVTEEKGRGTGGLLNSTATEASRNRPQRTKRKNSLTKPKGELERLRSTGKLE